MQQLHRIKGVVKGVLDRYITNESNSKEKEVADFIKYLKNKVPSYVMFNNKIIEEIDKYLSYTNTRQDILYSLLFDIVIELEIDGLKLQGFKSGVYDSYKTSMESILVDKPLYSMIKPKEKIDDTLLLSVYLIKISYI